MHFTVIKVSLYAKTFAKLIKIFVSYLEAQQLSNKLFITHIKKRAAAKKRKEFDSRKEKLSLRQFYLCAFV